MKTNAGELFKRAYINGTVHNELYIHIPVANEETSYTIRNENIVSESFKLTQSVCDDSDLRFGGCIASEFEIETTVDVDLTGRNIHVYLYQEAIMPTYPSEDTYPTADSSEIIATYPGHTVYKGYGGSSIGIFSGYIFSCKRSKNGIIRKIIAYDDMFWRGNVDCTAWYKALYRDHAQNGAITMGFLRKAIETEMGVRLQNANIALPADDMPVYMIEGTVTFIELLRQICEFNGCFAFINSAGRLEYKTIKSSNYVDGVNNIFESYEHYADVETEDFEKLQIPFDGLSILTGENNLYYPADLVNPAVEDNMYEINNELTKTGYTLQSMGTAVGAIADPNSVVSKVAENFAAAEPYTPISLKVDFRSWVEVGDKIRVPIYKYRLNNTRQREYVTSLVLSRTISGLPYLKDEITANGENYDHDDYID